MCNQVSKRPRSEIMEVSSHAGKDVSENVQGANGQVGRPWGWDDEGVVMDINILLSEFGDFSDFFQEEELDFGEVGILYSSCSMLILHNISDAQSILILVNMLLIAIC